MASWTSGGPLLTVDDLLQDLKQEAGPPKFPWSDQARHQADGVDDDGTRTPASNDSTTPNLGPVFERTYAHLKAALEQPGYAWLALTQKLCAGLALADEMVSSSQAEFRALLERMKALRSIVKRGQLALASASSAIANLESE